MAHILDNPVWNALVTGNAALAEGEGEVKVFPADVAPFVGLKEINPGNLARLYQRVAGERAVAIVAPSPIDIPEVWKVLNCVHALQMIYPASAKAAAAPPPTTTAARPPAKPTAPPPARAATPTAAPAAADKLVALGDKDVPAMLELTALTNPGPFYQRTIRFGSYTGIFDGDELVAMAGYRMHPGEFIEVSAVCTRPGYLGRGYARTLILHLVGLIRTQHCTPFLHVRKDNKRAIEVYHQLGFVIRHEMTINFIKKNVLATSGMS
jgi:ribosomal protein S18 acetylase RimI-like enzyme